MQSRTALFVHFLSRFHSHIFFELLLNFSSTFSAHFQKQQCNPFCQCKKKTVASFTDFPLPFRFSFSPPLFVVFVHVTSYFPHNDWTSKKYHTYTGINRGSTHTHCQHMRTLFDGSFNDKRRDKWIHFEVLFPSDECVCVWVCFYIVCICICCESHRCRENGKMF